MITATNYQVPIC